MTLVQEKGIFMSRPVSKDSLLKAMESEHQKLEDLLKTLNEKQMTQPGVCETWSVKDILAHLHAWEQLVLSWYRAGVRGQEVKTPASDLKWSETPILNQRIYEQYCDVSLHEIQAKFAASHDEVRATIKPIPEKELVTRGFYAWTKSTTLLSYFVSCTSSHYHWAYEEIRRWVKEQAKKRNGFCARLVAQICSSINSLTTPVTLKSQVEEIL